MLGLKSLLIICVLFMSTNIKAQFTQRLRGTVIDMVLQLPVTGATVSVPLLNKTVITDSTGGFSFSGVPVGTYSIGVSHTGFKDVFLNNVLVNSGKELVLSISLENTIFTENEVVVKSDSKRNKPLNDMSAVSARAFTVEETAKYAAAVNDPLRMATAFPGVLSAEDGNNDIIIRGNAPTGLLWKMEGVDIPNPNHFSEAGGTGGGISILSAQLLSNSDFVTGAFAPEYGNALSGVFDLKLRKGNNEQKEYTLQAGFLGLSAALEGPLAKGYKGSYLVNYRYSTLALLQKLGVTLTSGATNFQDLSYNVYLPTKRWGTFGLFGFGGLSSDREEAKKDSTKWTNKGDRYDSRFHSNTGLTALTHSIPLSRQTTLKSSLAYSINANGDRQQYMERDYQLSDTYADNYKTKKWNLASTLNHKFSNRTSLRSGAILNLVQFDYYEKSAKIPSGPLTENINTKERTGTLQAFTQGQYKATPKLTVNLGAHYLKLFYNNRMSVEPRTSVKWDVGKRSSVAVGYGLHSQVQAWGVYFAEAEMNGIRSQINRHLGFTKAHHFVLSHNLLVAENLRLKTEVYYQHLFKVPVSTSDTNTLSTVNVVSEYITSPLVNRGKGRNYGVEISLEKYLHNNFYYLFSNSLYQSKYTALDGMERNTRFNGNHISTLVGGKEFIATRKSKTFGINLKAIYAGGLRTTPVDRAASKLNGYTVFKQKEAFSLQNPSYFRTDLRLSMQWNKKKRTNTLSLDVQNVTNRQNVYNEWYDGVQDKVVYNYQNGLIPVLAYKVEF